MDNFNDAIDIILHLLGKRFDELRKDYESVETRSSNVWSSKWAVYVEEHKQIIVNDVIEENENVIEHIEVINRILELPNRLSENKKDDKATKLKILLVNIHVFHRLKMMALPEDKHLHDEDDIIRLKQDDNHWFRGQADFKWKLLPSYYRSFDNRDLLLDYRYMYEDYNKLGIIDKLDTIFRSKNLDYTALSFTQHTLAFTPLLDFTKDVYTALSFAVGNYQNPRLLNEEPAAIYAINKSYTNLINDDVKADFAIMNFQTEYIGSKPTITKIISSSFWNDFMLGKRTSQIHMINIETNDRMRMQSGTFVLFDNVLFVGDIMVVSFDKKQYFSSIVSKYKIAPSSRKYFYDLINQKYPKYQYQMLMFPYDFMQR